MIVAHLIPARVAFDATILISALDLTKSARRDLLAREVFEYAVRNCTVCIATPALAEALLGGHESLFGLPRVEFVDFDIRGAQAMYALLGNRAANKPDGSSRKIAKFDAMIVAAYLVRGRVGAFISADGRQSKMAKDIGLNTLSLEEVFAPDQPQFGQTALPGVLPAE